ncbi:alpha/beta hydrolase [Streptomyces boncukensis]|uniref:DUF1023 domain-containing protein n=1 Tax=Streptomyces boncukensis TaxID=2711219 RepID=A0A6G4X011_9ACTN|nr:alpha/beta hydrolase [Streptomyces boncukensis]NGO70462.1 hypothetical protein [Streptomyces boncukensis]
MRYATLAKLKPSEFEDAADGYGFASSMAGEAKDGLGGRITKGMNTALSGKAATEARTQVRKLAANFHYTQIECGLIRTSLNALAADLRAAKKKLEAAVAEAKAEGLTVNPDGSVTYPAGGDKVDGEVPEGGTVPARAGTADPGAAGNPLSPSREASAQAEALERQAANLGGNPHRAKAVAIANRIATAVREATEADQAWAPRLRALTADDDLDVSPADWADAQKDMRGARKGAEDYLGDIKDPPKDGTPKDNARWWKGLSDQERDDLVALRPASVGALDGLPADVRDEANRAVMAEKRGQYELRLAALRADEPQRTAAMGHETAAWREWDKKRERLEGKLNGMKAIQERFDRTGRDGLPEAYLLGFDPEGEGDGKVILANGNPDTADHRAVYVPGTGTDISKIGGDLGRGEDMWRESHKMAPGKNVSVISWFDYNAPDTIPQATSGSYAEKAGPRLQNFLEGAEAAQPGSSHTTVMGHSYGSTVIGESAKHHRIPADDIVVAGSPGMQVGHARDLGVGTDRVWAMGAGAFDDRVVRYGGKLVGLGEELTIPTDENFGGKIMKSDSGGHSGFWDENSQSLRNQAAVITGKYHRVELDD